MFSNTNSQHGLTLIEVLAALTILGVILAVFGTMMASSATTGAQNEERLDALYTAQDCMEDIRSERAEGTSISSIASDFCFTTDENTSLTLAIDASNEVTNLYDVQVTVEKIESNRPDVSVTLETKLYNELPERGESE
ncbi:prepilin-type N-terminal cleavage/methylation domain-containing protein [Salsuginibacillus halophilus]|uniref:Prepilin-type N-terminal cleavage/methylation domain-containing protein n=1 Tax=Salsuginibacillus halophilus TaxID=517424 RepID=A0A2P8HCL4_9BACI|nr:type II secretion system protein [Salsuginibacillus halophilus]PSL43985.1 prepilin-type N-terminal cleavage/methylation domain-containing protein [Salsuginibacillus halophilus]